VGPSPVASWPGVWPDISLDVPACRQVARSAPGLAFSSARLAIGPIEQFGLPAELVPSWNGWPDAWPPRRPVGAGRPERPLGAFSFRCAGASGLAAECVGWGGACAWEPGPGLRAWRIRSRYGHQAASGRWSQLEVNQRLGGGCPAVAAVVDRLNRRLTPILWSDVLGPNG